MLDSGGYKSIFTSLGGEADVENLINVAGVFADEGARGDLEDVDIVLIVSVNHSNELAVGGHGD